MTNDHHANFSQYKTYSWAKVDMPDPLWNDRVKEAIDKQLSAKGRTGVPGGGDVSILEEDPITGDAEGEVWFPEELDDSEYPAREFTVSADTADLEKQLERTEQMQLALQALSRVPELTRG